MARMRSVRIKAINYNVTFTEASGSYYDYAGELLYADSEHIKDEITKELLSKGWREIPNKDTLLYLFEKNRHIIRVYRIWE